MQRTLKSLECQSFLDFEVLVIDDGSTDGTDTIVRNYARNTILDIAYLRKENGGKHTALNLGIQKAQGILFLILDSDDVLTPDALLHMKSLWDSLEDKEKYCGIMGKCSFLQGNGNTVIGEYFPKDSYISSYIDFHFGSGFSLHGNRYGDCCECVRTDILKKYRYPERFDTRFVPESYIFDKIGLGYKLLCTNTILEFKEYREDGITVNSKIHREENIAGYLVKYVSNIEEILPMIHAGVLVRLKMWKNYWDAVQIDTENKGPRLKNISMFGNTIRYLIPLLNIMKRVVKG